MTLKISAKIRVFGKILAQKNSKPVHVRPGVAMVYLKD